jgi:hypothetical protein
MEKETIEEATDRYAEIYRCPATNNNEYCKHDIISAINFGAKWQAERMYSEEEPDYDKIKEALVEIRKIPMTFSPDERMYSEEEVYKLLLKHQSDYRSSVRNSYPLTWSFDIKEWFEEVKKK